MQTEASSSLLESSYFFKRSNDLQILLVNIENHTLSAIFFKAEENHFHICRSVKNANDGVDFDVV